MQFFKCHNAGLSGIGIRVPQSGTGMLWYWYYWTDMLDAGIPMPSYGKYILKETSIFLLSSNLPRPPLPQIGTDSSLTPTQREVRLREVWSFWLSGAEEEWCLKPHILQEWTFSKIMCIFIIYYFFCVVNAEHASMLHYTEMNDSPRRDLRCF